MELRFWAATDVGRVRDHNEDNFLVDKKLQLFVVCDGMGGHAAGEVASAVCVRTVRDVVAAEADLILRMQKNPGDPMGRQVLEDLLGRAIRTASARIFEMAQKDPSRRGMGTTCITMVLVGNRGFVGHVGDSRLYRVRDQSVEQISIDHSLLNEMIRQGKIPPTTTEAEFPHNNAVTRAVGVREAVDVETFQFELQKKDRLLMCSDGLSEYFRNGVDVLELIGSDEPKETTARCIDHANRSGGKDNITVVVVDYGLEENEEERMEAAQVLEILQKTAYFHYLAPQELEYIRKLANRMEFSAEETIVGDEADRSRLYIILKGSVSLQLEGKQLSVLMAGEHFGEMALIDAQDEYDKKIIVRALEPTLVLVIERDAFMGLLRSAPPLAVKLLWNFVQVFADRLQAVPTRFRFSPDDWRLDSDGIDVTPPAGSLIFEEDLKRIDGGAEQTPDVAVQDEPLSRLVVAGGNDFDFDEDSEPFEDQGEPVPLGGLESEGDGIPLPEIEEGESSLGSFSSLSEDLEEDPLLASRKTIDLGMVDFSRLDAKPPRKRSAEEDDMATPPPGPILADKMPPTGEFLFHPENFEDVLSEPSESEGKLDSLPRAEKLADELPLDTTPRSEDEYSDPNETRPPWEGMTPPMGTAEEDQGEPVKPSKKRQIHVGEPDEDLSKTVDIGANLEQLRALRAKTSGSLKDKLRERMKERPAPSAEVLKKASTRVTAQLEAAKRAPQSSSEDSGEKPKSTKQLYRVGLEESAEDKDQKEKESKSLGSSLSGSSIVEEGSRRSEPVKQPKIMIAPDLMADSEDES